MVFFPTTFLGFTISTRGSFEVLKIEGVEEIPIPGQSLRHVTHPWEKQSRWSPFEINHNDVFLVTAVIGGDGIYNPICPHFGRMIIKIGIPVSISGPTMSGLTRKYFSAIPSAYSNRRNNGEMMILHIPEIDMVK
jgi:hypothetical protein